MDSPVSARACERLLKPALRTLGPGVSSTKTSITHSGDGFVHVMKGALTCEMGNQKFARPIPRKTPFVIDVSACLEEMGDKWRVRAKWSTA